MMYVDHKLLPERDFHFLMKYACMPNPARTRPASTTPARGTSSRAWAAAQDAQLVAGLTPPAFVERGGVVEDHAWIHLLMFKHLYRMELDGAADGVFQSAETEDNVVALLQAAGSLAEAEGIVKRLLAERLARSLAVAIEAIDVGKPAYAFGVDSHVAVELTCPW